MDAQRPGALIRGSADRATGTSARVRSLDDRLRGAGLRSTRQRATVLTLLDDRGGHLSADELVVALADAGTALPRSTVFKVLDDLVSAGLVQRAVLGTGPVRFESAEMTGPHHHFVCKVCGSVEDVPHEVVPVDTTLIGAEHEVHRVEMVLRGRCSRCRAADRPDPAERPD